MQTATAKTEDGRPIPATVATLEVTPQESELLFVAQQQGSIQLVLRGYGDPDSVKTRGATSADVERGLRDAPLPRPTANNRTARRPTPPRVVAETVHVRDPVAVAPKPKADTNKVEVFRGATKTELKFSKDSARRDTIPKN
jgi:pilus assembly protein CpaB